MSIVQLRVELPAYAYSFVIHVPRSCTISDVKQEIFRTCVGGPRVEGQRIVWRGRYLVDHEKVDELWKSIDEPQVVHLAVHPSAWSSNPPEVPQAIQSRSSTSNSATSIPQTVPQHIPVPSEVPAQPLPTSTMHPLAYVLFKHQNALIALMSGTVIPTQGNELEVSRQLAVQAVERHGWSWPSILDDDFPPATPGGVRYESVVIDGQSFLSLCDSEPPTPLQTHAIKVLTYTYTLLSIPSSSPNPSTTASSQTEPIPPHVELLLRQLGLPHPRGAPNLNPNLNPNVNNGMFLELREMPLRPLLAPLMMLVFRTLLLLYFVAPARKPVFGILILAWMLYEIWRPIRENILRGLRRANGDPDDQQRQNDPQGQPMDRPANAPNADPPRPANPAGGIAAAQHGNHATVFLDTLGNMNIAGEERILDEAPGSRGVQPSLGHKLVTFLGLFLTTVHPDIWNRRRVALRRREGRIRTEANIRNAPPPDNEGEDAPNENRTQLQDELRSRYAQRPPWVRNYMERVVAGDWVDDAD